MASHDLEHRRPSGDDRRGLGGQHADGLFHGFAFVVSLVGLFLVWGAVRNGARLSGRHLVGLMLAGWGLFNLVEGVIDHQILAVHHVNPDNVVLWDTLFLIFGAALLAGGWALARAGERAEERDAFSR